MQRLRPSIIACIGAVVVLLTVATLVAGKYSGDRFRPINAAQSCAVDCLDVFVQKLRTDLLPPLRSTIKSGTIKIDDLETSKLTDWLTSLGPFEEQGLIDVLSTRSNSKLIFNLRRRNEASVTIDTLYVIIPYFNSRYCQKVAGGPLPNTYKTLPGFYVAKDNQSIVEDAYFAHEWNGGEACVLDSKSETYLFWPIIGRAKSNSNSAWQLQ